jgi:hypothetical protein
MNALSNITPTVVPDPNANIPLIFHDWLSNLVSTYPGGCTSVYPKLTLSHISHTDISIDLDHEPEMPGRIIEELYRLCCPMVQYCLKTYAQYRSMLATL